MSTLAQTRVISTPALYISGVLIKVVPNSVTMHLGNGSNPRAVSAGGGSIEIVNGVDASKLMNSVKFDIASTSENIANCRAWINNANNGGKETLRVVDVADQFSFDEMYLANDLEAHLKSDGNISVEWKGRYVQ
jgi:hypothetical protein